jgi:hypothetical protein
MSGESGDAILSYNYFDDGVMQKAEIPVFVTEVDIYGQEFYNSYQSGITVQCAFEVNSYDFEASKHINDGKPAYASEIIYNEISYNIIRHQAIKNTEKTLLICG